MSAAVTTVPDRRTIVSLIARLRTPAGQAAPEPLYAKLRQMGDLVPAPWGGHLAVSYDACNEILKGRRWFVPDHEWRSAQEADTVRWDRPAVHSLSQTLAGLNPPEHTRQRRALGNVFDRNTLSRLQQPVEHLVDRILGGLERQLRRRGTADFVHEVSEELPVRTLGQWLGIPERDQPTVRRLTHEHAYAGELLPTKSQLEISDAASAGLDDYFRTLVRKRRSRPDAGALSEWIPRIDAIEPDRETADRTLKYLAMFLSMAALETTSTTLSTMVWLLDRHPAQRQELLADIGLAPNAFEETVRYDPPIHVVTRVATEDTDVAGHKVQQGDAVHVMVAAAHHEPDRYSEPGTFDLRRSATHLGFGGGAHYCIGAALARLQGRILLEGLLRRMPTLRVTAEPTWAPRVVFRRLTHMPVSL